MTCLVIFHMGGSATHDVDDDEALLGSLNYLNGSGLHCLF